MSSKRFTIAVSFPGEHRKFVLEVVNELAKELGKDRIFYDEWFQHELVGVDADLKLRQIYREQSKMIVPFFSQHYEKPWCKVEWSAIRALLLECRKDDLVIPVALDDTVIPGWEATDFAIRRKRLSVKSIAHDILKTLRHRERNSPTSDQPPGDVKLTESERVENARLEGINRLKTAVVEILQSDGTRRFILKKNELPANLSATDLTDRIFDVIPQIRGADEKHTPMCFLFRCTSPPALDDKERRVICDHLGRIAALVAPVSFMVDDTTEIVSMIQKAADSAQIPSDDQTVAASLVAAILGLPVDFEQRESIEDANGFVPTGPPVNSWGALHGASLVPVGGIEERDIVNVVARGLAPLVGAISSQLPFVRAKLLTLAAGNSYVCLLFKRALHPDATKALKAAFPDLFILTSNMKEESVINALVMTQLVTLKQYIEGSK